MLRSTVFHWWHHPTPLFQWNLESTVYLEITDYKNSQSNPNVVIRKHGHLCFNIHPDGTNTVSNNSSPLPQSYQWCLTRTAPCHSQQRCRRCHFSSLWCWCCRCTSCWGHSTLGSHAHTPQMCLSSCCTRAAWEERRRHVWGRTGPPPPSSPCPSR